MKTLTELTAELRALFSGPEKWNKHLAARTQDQKSIVYTDPDAFCFCLLGGIWRVQALNRGCSGVLQPLCRKAILEIDPAQGPCSELVSISYWQDKPERTFEDIQKVLAKMAEIAARP